MPNINEVSGELPDQVSGVDFEFQKKLQQLKTDLGSRPDEAADRINSLARENMSAVLEAMPDLLRNIPLTPELWSSLNGHPFTPAQLQGVAAVLVSEKIEAAQQVLRPGGYKSGNTLYSLVGRIETIIRVASLQHSIAVEKLRPELVALLVDARCFGRDSDASAVYTVATSLEFSISSEDLRTEILGRLKTELSDPSKDVFQCTRVVLLARKAGDIPSEICALAEQAFPSFAREYDASRYVKIFSIRQNIVQAEAKKNVKRCLEDIMTLSNDDSENLLKDEARRMQECDISFDIIEPDALKAFEEMIDAANMEKACAIGRHLRINVHRFEEEPLRTKLKDAFHIEVTKALKGEEGESATVERFEAMLPPRDDGGVRTFGYFSRWYCLGKMPVLEEVLDDALYASANFSRKSVVKFKDQIILPPDFQASEHTLTALRENVITSTLPSDVRSQSLPLFAQRWGVNLQDSAIQDVARRNLIRGIRVDVSNSFEFAPAVLSQDITEYCQSYELPDTILQDNEMRDACIDRVCSELRSGHMDKAQDLSSYMSLEPIGSTPTYKKAISEGFIALFVMKGTIEKALDFSRAANMDDAFLAETISTSFTLDPLPTLRALDLLPGKVLQRLETPHHLKSYFQALGIPSKSIYEEYARLADAKDTVALPAYCSKIQAHVESLSSGAKQNPDVVLLPHYRELMELVFPNNAGHWTNFERNEACEDRSDDLAAYKVRDNYSFTVAPGQDMVLKDGRKKDEVGFASLHAPIEKAHQLFFDRQDDREGMLRAFDDILQKDVSILQPQNVFETREQKLFGLLLENARGTYPAQKLKEHIILYQYAAFADIREYVEGTRGRAEKTRNPEYAYLLELREFFADRLKDVSRKISEDALKNPALQAMLPTYFASIALREKTRVSGEGIAKLQVGKLGLSEGFLKQIALTLRKKKGRDYSMDEVRELIREYEDRTEGMAESEPPVGEFDTAIYRQIHSQRMKTIRALETLSGTSVHPSEIRLGDVNLQEHLNQRRTLESGEYNEQVFSAYIVRTFGTVFGQELDLIDTEIAKYEPKDAERVDAKPKRVEAFIAKNHTSAHARGTAGVCVSGDNPVPDESGLMKPNQWQMPNYLQMVLRDGETKLCKGCVLMHMEEDEGKKILTISFNPSSTYLYQVNEEEMFRQLREQLIVFAKDNDVDAIAVSQNKQIRTNRTGGLFERAMDKAIADTKQSYTFSTERVFSHTPKYPQKDVDFIWMAEK